MSLYHIYIYIYIYYPFKVFRWAQASRKGLVLFIDEAESFLIDRRTVVTQTQREMLATFLSNTGSASKK